MGSPNLELPRSGRPRGRPKHASFNGGSDDSRRTVAARTLSVGQWFVSVANLPGCELLGPVSAKSGLLFPVRTGLHARYVWIPTGLV